MNPNELRLALKLTITDFAHLAKVSYPTAHSWCHGRTAPFKLRNIRRMKRLETKLKKGDK